MPIETTVHNERVKLFASFLNTAGTATVAAGVLSQVAAFTFGLPTAPTVAGLGYAIADWLLAGLALHGMAQWTLGGLRE